MGHWVEFREQDALTGDVFPATVVTLYWLPEVNNELKPNLGEQLRANEGKATPPTHRIRLADR